MSLTSHLGSSQDPVARWFASNFPETRRLATDENRRIRGGPATTPCPLAPPPDADPPLVGTALGYLLSASVDAAQLEDSVAVQGATSVDMRLDSRGEAQLGTATAVASASIQRLGELVSADALSDTDWEELCRVAVVVARFEQFYRAAPYVWHLVVPPLTQSTDPNVLGALMADAATLSDLNRITREALATYSWLRDAAELRLGPSFARSKDLGGADADLIADGVLLELKSGASAPLSRAHLWQLLGYALADTDDRYSIKSVGFLWPRWRADAQWPLDEYLTLLGGNPSVTLAQWRDRFAELCAAVVAERLAEGLARARRVDAAGAARRRRPGIRAWLQRRFRSRATPATRRYDRQEPARPTDLEGK